MLLHARVGERADRSTTGINLRFDTTNDPARDLFSQANFPNASARAAGRCARSLRAPDRARRRRHRRCRLDDAGNVRRVRSRSAPGQDGHALAASRRTRGASRLPLTLNAGRPLGRAAAVHADQRTSCRPRPWPTSAGCPAWATAAPISKCRLQQPGRPAAIGVPEYVNLHDRGTEGYNTDWNNFAPNVGVAWRPERGERLAAHAARRSRTGDAARRLLGRVTSVRAWPRSSASTTTILAAPQPHPRRLHRHRRTRRNVAGPPCGSPSRLYNALVPGHAHLSDCQRGRIEPTTSRRSRRTSRSHRRAPGRSASSDR